MGEEVQKISSPISRDAKETGRIIVSDLHVSVNVALHENRISLVVLSHLSGRIDTKQGDMMMKQTWISS